MTEQSMITAKEFFEQLVETPPDNHCRTCFYWKQSIHWGECANNTVQAFRTGLNIQFHESYGCIFHEAKE